MWKHGYFTGSAYVSGFYREMGPLWMDFACHVKGHSSPRSAEGCRFTYLELGSGTGLHLCLLAAAYPEGRFLGIDLMPDHVLASQRFADRLQLSNVHFIQADLADLSTQVDPLGRVGLEPASCDYITSHGLFSWVAENVQEATLSLVTRYLRLGGCFYCSYNTFPGWLTRSVFYTALQHEMDRSGPYKIVEAISTTNDRLTRLLGSEDLKSDLSSCFPALKNEMEAIKVHNTDYLTHEFGNRSWNPLYVNRMHGLCRAAGLSYLASATIPELFDDLLPEPVRGVVLSTADEDTRELMRDIGTMQSFRRDLFVYGKIPANRLELEQVMAEKCIQLMRKEEDSDADLEVGTPFGPVILNKESRIQLIQGLAHGPRTLGELGLETGLSMDAVIRSVALLLHAGVVGLHRGETAKAARGSAVAANRSLIAMGQEGLPFTYLVASACGTAIPLQTIDAWLLPAVMDGLEGSGLIECVRLGVSLAGITLKRGMEDYESEETLNQDILERAQLLRTTTLPLLQELGAI